MEHYETMDIAGLRQEINKINDQILSLFQQRMEISKWIGRYKKEHGQPIFDPVREQEILDRVLSASPAEYRYETLEMYRTLMNASKNYQYAVTAAPRKLHYKRVDSLSPSAAVFQGVEGSYSSLACHRLFPETPTLCVKEFEEVFMALKDGKADLGVLPIENSSTGTLYEVYDLIQKYGCFIAGEKVIKIEHNLLGLPGADPAAIQKLYSHPQAFQQCSRFLKESGYETIPYYNTAIAAEKVAKDGDPAAGVLAGKEAAALYGLTILKENVSDSDRNYTRFAVISQEPIIPAEADKVSVMFTLADKTGSLHNALSVFAFQNLNLTKLESRPSPDHPFHYIFLADFEGSFDQRNIELCLSVLEQETQQFRFLGNYRKD